MLSHFGVGCGGRLEIFKEEERRRIDPNGTGVQRHVLPNGKYSLREESNDCLPHVYVNTLIPA